MDINGLMRRFSIRVRMIGAIAMVLAMFGVVGASGLLGGRQLQNLNNDFMAGSVKELGNFADIRAALAEVRLWEKEMVINYENPEAVVKTRGLWDAAIKKTQAGLAALQEGEEDQDNVEARAAIAALDAYAKASAPVLRQIEQSGFDSARVADRMLNRAKQQMDIVEKHVASIGVILHEEVEQTKAEFGASMTRVGTIFIATLVAVVALVVPLTLLNSRTITRPISYARSVAQGIAAGDLNRNIEVSGEDEPAELLTALRAMQDALRHLVGQVRESTEQIGTASAEVASGNQDLSQRTEQSSSNLQQTASAMEQLTGTVRQSAESAATANQLAGSAAQVAQRGGQVVGQVVSTMDEINASSRKISDIIGVIDGIAFQTNILALNAAVEAARAGEQGRGFAVVAGEVRLLAQRSGEAAREIKALIGASVERVAVGARLVQDAGTTMSEIVASVQRVSDIIGEIAAGTSNQSQRLGEVNGTINQLDQMTQQNAALVEQSAAAAESLKEQSRRLSDAVAQFHLDPR